jgi:hypothetical protein
MVTLRFALRQHYTRKRLSERKRPDCNMPHTLNRRGFHRLTTCRHEFSVQATGARQLRLTTLNLSLGGAFFESHIKFPIDTPLLLQLSERERKEVASARVVYVNERGFGAAFVEPPAGFIELLREIIAAHRAQERAATVSKKP